MPEPSRPVATPGRLSTAAAYGMRARPMRALQMGARQMRAERTRGERTPVHLRSKLDPPMRRMDLRGAVAPVPSVRHAARRMGRFLGSSSPLGLFGGAVAERVGRPSPPRPPRERVPERESGTADYCVDGSLLTTIRRAASWTRERPPKRSKPGSRAQPGLAPWSRRLTAATRHLQN